MPKRLLKVLRLNQPLNANRAKVVALAVDADVAEVVAVVITAMPPQ